MELVRVAFHQLDGITCCQACPNVPSAAGACNDQGYFQYMHPSSGASYFRVQRRVGSHHAKGQTHSRFVTAGWKQFQFLPRSEANTGDGCFILFLHTNSTKVLIAKLPSGTSETQPIQEVAHTNSVVLSFRHVNFFPCGLGQLL